MHENKIALVIKNDLLNWQKLNVTAFLASAVAIRFPETHGQALVSASDTNYLPFLKQPVMVYKADAAEELSRAFQRAKDRELHIGIYTNSLFATKNESENLTEIAKVTDDALDLVGIVVYGDRRKVDKALNGLKFHA